MCYTISNSSLAIQTSFFVVFTPVSIFQLFSKKRKSNDEGKNTKTCYKTFCFAYKEQRRTHRQTFIFACSREKRFRTWWREISIGYRPKKEDFFCWYRLQSGLDWTRFRRLLKADQILSLTNRQPIDLRHEDEARKKYKSQLSERR